MKAVAVYIMLVLLGVETSASSDGGGSPAFRHRGLVFEAGAGTQLTTSMPVSTAGDVVFMGAGYLITPLVEVALKVYSGAQDVRQDAARPVGGRLLLGGGGVEGTFLFSDKDTWRPFVAGGFELVTLLANAGYNGSGPHVACGVQADLSHYFSVRAGIQYARWRFYNPLGEDNSFGSFAPFVDNSIGGNLSVAFYPNILP